MKATLGTTTTVYIGNYYEQSGNITTTYYYAGGTRLAMRRGVTVTFLLGDHLGSTALAANGTTGALISEQRYKPWGEQRYTNGALPTRRQYTGQINDVEIGLYFYSARMYSSVLGRFLSADTMVPSPANPQSLNRYAYVLGNPLRYTDPTGHDVDCGLGESGCRRQSKRKQATPPQPLPPPLASDPEYSLWYGDRFSGCTLCHYAVANDKAILTNFELLDTDFNARKAQITGQAVMLVSGGAVIIVIAGKEIIVTSITACSANDNCRNAVGNATQKGLEAFQRADEFGIRTYDNLRMLTKNTGLHAHHLIEKRFAGILGVNPGDIPSVALTPQEHTPFTRLWQQQIGYSNQLSALTTNNATLADIWNAAQVVYAGHPVLLDSVKSFLGIP